MRRLCATSLQELQEPTVSKTLTVATIWLLLFLQPCRGALGVGQVDEAQQPVPQAEDSAEDARSSGPAAAAPEPSFKELPREFLRDECFLLLRPFRSKRADLPWAAALLGTTAGLIAIDRRAAQNLSNSPPGAGYSLSRGVGKLGSPLVVAGLASQLYIIGRWRGNTQLQTTGLLGLRALADSLVIAEVLKNATQRPRPTFPGGVRRNHNADGQFFSGGRAFPSGHAVGAWALATVVARRHGRHRWVGPTVYGLASLVSFARVTQRRHFPSDIFVGSAVGYLVGRHVAHSVEERPTVKSSRVRLEPHISFMGGVAVNLSIVVHLR